VEHLVRVVRISSKDDILLGDLCLRDSLATHPVHTLQKVQEPSERPRLQVIVYCERGANCVMLVCVPQTLPSTTTGLLDSLLLRLQLT
jgi:hypothetical protein